MQKNIQKTKDTYMCIECNKGFSSSSELKKHNLSHMGPKINKNMGRRLGQRNQNHMGNNSNLSNIVSHHHSSNNIHNFLGNKKTFTCKQCNQSFSNSKALGQHIDTHFDDEGEGADDDEDDDLE